ncbi:hypothetical protein NLX62_06790 [Mycobacteriaceae bacterium Msp059]|nr:hypothetical protein [Mycobacteriaceae bacterium Msp059]
MKALSRLAPDAPADGSLRADVTLDDIFIAYWAAAQPFPSVKETLSQRL